MIEKNTQRYIDVLQKIVTSYNHTWHSGIRSEPVNVNKQNEKPAMVANVLAKGTLCEERKEKETKN